MFERFTDRARKIMALANQEAQRFNHEYIGTEHILLGLVKEGSGVAANVLKNLGVDLRKVRLDVEKLVEVGPELVTMGRLPQTPRAKKVVEYAILESRNLNHNYVGSEHILLGLLREQDGVAAQVLVNLGVKLEVVREELLTLFRSGQKDSEPGRGGEQAMSPPEPPRFPETVESSIRKLLEAYDSVFRDLMVRKSDCIGDGATERATTLRDEILRRANVMTFVFRELLRRDAQCAQSLAGAVAQVGPNESLTSARFLLALIQSNPALAARLAPLMPEIEKACREQPPDARPCAD